VIGLGRDACRSYRAELAVIATRRETGSPATYEHLGRCVHCRDEVQGLALASLALERLAEEDDRFPAARSPEAPDPTWLAVRRRATTVRGPLFRWRGHLAGLIVGAGLAAAIIAPLPAHDQSRPLYDSGTQITFSGSRDIADQKAEDAWLWANQLARKESPSVDIVRGPYDPSIFGEGPFAPVRQSSDTVGHRAR
jgi:hypothetical protein